MPDPNVYLHVIVGPEPTSTDSAATLFGSHFVVEVVDATTADGIVEGATHELTHAARSGNRSCRKAANRSRSASASTDHSISTVPATAGTQTCPRCGATARRARAARARSRWPWRTADRVPRSRSRRLGDQLLNGHAEFGGPALKHVRRVLVDLDPDRGAHGLRIAHRPSAGASPRFAGRTVRFPSGFEHFAAVKLLSA